MTLKDILEYYVSQAARLAPSQELSERMAAHNGAVAAPDCLWYPAVGRMAKLVPADHPNRLAASMLRMSRACLGTAIDIIKNEIRTRAAFAIYCLERMDGAAGPEADALRGMLEAAAGPTIDVTPADAAQIQDKADDVCDAARKHGAEPAIAFAEDAVSHAAWIRALAEMLHG